MHLLKNGHPAHVFTDEDRRKAAAVTNEIRRAKRELFEQLRHDNNHGDVTSPQMPYPSPNSSISSFEAPSSTFGAFDQTGRPR